MDNQKYIKIEKLLSFMRETFGYNEDIQQFIKNSVTEAEIIL